MGVNRSSSRCKLSYPTLNGSTRGPLLGTVQPHLRGWRGVLSAVTIGSVGALYSSAAARSLLQPLKLPPRHEPNEAPQDIRQRWQAVMLWADTMRFFLSAFCEIADQLQARAAMRVLSAGAATRGMLQQRLSLEATAPALVLTMAPLLAGLPLLRRQRYREHSAPAQISVGLAALLWALWALWLTTRTQPHAWLTVPSLLTVAELLLRGDRGRPANESCTGPFAQERARPTSEHPRRPSSNAVKR